jgi:ketohexokinase
MQILATGVATLDIINQVECYPSEDDEVRAQAQTIRLGGNAANTLAVLSQFGHSCSWAGSLADDADSQTILGELERFRIRTSASCCHPGGKSPTSYVVLSRRTASRTIVHYRNLPEYRARDFAAIDCSDYDWIHFEGRNVAETRMMLERLRTYPDLCPISLEVEKPRDGIEELWTFPGVLLFSKVFANSRGWENPEDLFREIRKYNETAWLFCAWGADGAWMQTPEGEILQQQAFVPSLVVDTLGAGDVFNAGVIHGMLKGLPAPGVIRLAVELAGKKCAQWGLEGLVDD